MVRARRSVPGLFAVLGVLFPPACGEAEVRDERAEALARAEAVMASGEWLRSKGEVRAREDRIDRELAALSRSGTPHAWAGEYYLGDGLGTNVTVKVAPESGFTYVLVACTGLRDQAHGELHVEGDVLVLEPDPATGEEEREHLRYRYQLVRWGTLRFLVTPDRKDEFLRAAAEGGFEEPFPGEGARRLFLCDVETREDPLRGEPELPAAWADRRTAEDDERR